MTKLYKMLLNLKRYLLLVLKSLFVIFQQLDELLNSTVECVEATRFLQTSKERALLKFCLYYPREFESAWLCQTIMTILVICIALPCIYASVWHRLRKVQDRRSQAKVDAILEKHELQKSGVYAPKKKLVEEEEEEPQNQLVPMGSRQGGYRNDGQQMQPIVLVMPPQPDQSAWGTGARRYSSRPGAKRDTDMVNKRSSRITSLSSLTDAVSDTGTMKRTPKGGIIRRDDDDSTLRGGDSE